MNTNLKEEQKIKVHFIWLLGVVTSEDSTTFNGMDYFKKENTSESPVKIDSFSE